MDLTELRIFKAVAEQGGILRAASILNRVQSNVTTRVKRLEARLGTRLFNREGRRLVLSAEGKILLDYAERLLRLSSEAQAAVKGRAPHGALKLGALESTAATRLPQVLARFHKTHPTVRLELVTGTTAALAARMMRGELDGAFIAEPFSARNLESEPAFVEELVLITPKGHPRVTTPKDLRESTILAFASGCAYRRRLEAWLGRSSMVAERVMEYGSYHAIVACAAAGSGIAVVPRSVLRASGMEAQLAVHALPPKIANARTLLVWRRGHQSAALEALRKELR
jgi:DNA-binding transcriptional LysR family regulator